MKWSIRTVSLSTTFLIIVLSTISSVVGAAYDIQFIPWGQKCRIPKPGEFLLPHEDCDEANGISCQKYSQGDYCGCRIGSMLSYDRQADQCRRIPGHHCVFVNVTLQPDVLPRLPYHVKCHENAECFRREGHPDKATGEFNAVLDICECKPGYLTSRDGLECVDVNAALPQVPPTGLFILLTLTTLTIFAS